MYIIILHLKNSSSFAVTTSVLCFLLRVGGGAKMSPLLDAFSMLAFLSISIYQLAASFNTEPTISKLFFFKYTPQSHCVCDFSINIRS